MGKIDKPRDIHQVWQSNSKKNPKDLQGHYHWKVSSYPVFLSDFPRK